VSTSATNHKHGATCRQRPISGSFNHMAGMGLDLSLAFVGLLLNVLAYQSLFPAAAALLIFGLSGCVVAVVTRAGSWEFRIFRRLCATGWVSCGLAGIFAEHLSDPSQLTRDAASFFEFASRDASGLNLDQIRERSEGSLVVYVWRAAYDAFAALEFPRERYLGVLVNVLFVALTGVIAVQMVRQMYGADSTRASRMTLLMPCSGAVWLFAGLHLRDSAALLLVTGLAKIWLWYMKNPRFSLRLGMVAGLSVLMAPTLVLVRTEYLFMPFAFGLAALGSMLLVNALSPARIAAVVAGVLLVSAVFLGIKEDLGAALATNTRGYVAQAEAEASSESLGMKLVVKQPMPIRALVGTLYLYVSPFPMWSGLLTNSAYHWFKSANALFSICILPLLIIASSALFRSDGSSRKLQLVFLLLVVLGTSAAVALTSLETRHLGTFLVPTLLIALEPDLNNAGVRKKYLKLLSFTLIGAVFAHLVWLMVKL
jgi:hypothetical protein